jgi:hypothetical protein
MHACMYVYVPANTESVFRSESKRRKEKLYQETKTIRFAVYKTAYARLTCTVHLYHVPRIKQNYKQANIICGDDVSLGSCIPLPPWTMWVVDM